MTLLVGTDEGLYRAEGVPFDRSELEKILDRVMVTAVETWEHTGGVFAANVNRIEAIRTAIDIIHHNH
ncbi:hypothetical protein EA462_00140 [Natrarchaeobius halalkaliphilus]|uniref:Uncharacterized protein n=1 Tax=Natrarchaeobius halalkaliphilus TaxID=1679091 RepID=A0A3N6N3I8_9EURY|nr:hypothetical protein [Natrarchaeobius halalkaliphilus]RQG92682.1 hypothetical protein EA462_00140 [Natrarchaeobius halalkaliphilus]